MSEYIRFGICEEFQPPDKRKYFDILNNCSCDDISISSSSSSVCPPPPSSSSSSSSSSSLPVCDINKWQFLGAGQGNGQIVSGFTSNAKRYSVGPGNAINFFGLQQNLNMVGVSFTDGFGGSLPPDGNNLPFILGENVLILNLGISDPNNPNQVITLDSVYRITGMNIGPINLVLGCPGSSSSSSSSSSSLSCGIGNEVCLSSDGRYQAIVGVLNGGNSIYLSHDYGNLWYSIKDIDSSFNNNDFNWRHISMSDNGQYLLAYAQNQNLANNKIYISNNFGKRWSSPLSIGQVSVLNVQMTSNGQNQFVFVSNGSIYTSTDYGETWKVNVSNFNGNLINSKVVINKESGQYLSYVADNSSSNNIGCYTSNDSGLNWNLVKNISYSTTEAVDNLNIAMSNSNDIAFVMMGILPGPGYHYSNNFGLTWNSNSFSWNRSPENLASIGMSSDGKSRTIMGGLFVSNEAQISHDYGTTWSNIQLPAENFISNVAINSDGKYQLLAGNKCNLLSLNSGYTWASITRDRMTISPNPVTNYRISNVSSGGFSLDYVAGAATHIALEIAPGQESDPWVNIPNYNNRMFFSSCNRFGNCAGSVNITGLEPLTRYRVRARGVSLLGTGQYSYSVSLTTKSDTNTILLLRGEGNDNSNIFIDSSSYNWSITPLSRPSLFTPTAITETGIKKVGNSSMKFFDGVPIQTTDVSDVFNLGTENFTIEAWIYPVWPQGAGASVSTSQNIITFAPDFYNGMPCFPCGIQIALRVEPISNINDNIYTLDFIHRSATVFSAPPKSIRQFEWTHIAVVRNGNDLRMYINGQSVANTILPPGTDYNYPPPENLNYGIAIGNVRNRIYDSIYAGGYNGNIDELRISKGIARYTSTFNPSEQELLNN